MRTLKIYLAAAGDSGTPAYHWIMGKMITDPSQITEGLRTAKER